MAYGATRPTGDLDFIPARDRDNLGRLADAMRELGAFLRVQGLSDDEARALPVQLNAESLARIEISTWKSDAGEFDVLADMPARDGSRHGYDDLLPRSVQLEVHGVGVRVAALDDVIASKEFADRPKDHEALPELREIARRQE